MDKVKTKITFVRSKNVPRLKEEKFHVFVYGSLLSGYGNNRPFLKNAKLLGSFVTLKRYLMVSLGGFPGVSRPLKRVVEDHVSTGLSLTLYHKVRGEIYEVNSTIMEALDMLEGNGHFYTRREVNIQGFDKPVWIYLLPPSESVGSSGLVELNDAKEFCWRTHKSLTSTYPY